MKTILRGFVSILILAMGLSSCSKEDETFEDIDFKVTGTELHDMPLNNHTHYGTLPAEGGTITFEAQGKNKDQGFIGEVSCGNYLWDRSQLHDAKYPQTICDEDWGGVTIISDSPHTTKLVATANATGSIREIRLSFGGAYTTSVIYIKQPSR